MNLLLFAHHLLLASYSCRLSCLLLHASLHNELMLCVGIWKPGGGLFDSFFGIDTSLGDAWVLNPVDFASGNPSTSPGTVIVRPVVTNQIGLHVEFSLTCQGCASLTGTVVPPIDKSDPKTHLWASPTPQSIYNYNPQTASAVQSIPLFQHIGVYVACSNCYLALLQAGLYLAVDYNEEANIGFQTIQIEADATVLANLDLTLASDGTQDSSYVNPLVTNRILFQLPFLVAGIAFSATIEADLSAVFSVKGSGRMSITTGKSPKYTYKQVLQLHLLENTFQLAIQHTCTYPIQSCRILYHVKSETALNILSWRCRCRCNSGFAVRIQL